MSKNDFKVTGQLSHLLNSGEVVTRICFGAELDFILIEKLHSDLSADLPNSGGGDKYFSNTTFSYFLRACENKSSTFGVNNSVSVENTASKVDIFVKFKKVCTKLSSLSWQKMCESIFHWENDLPQEKNTSKLKGVHLHLSELVFICILIGRDSRIYKYRSVTTLCLAQPSVVNTFTMHQYPPPHPVGPPHLVEKKEVLTTLIWLIQMGLIQMGYGLLSGVVRFVLNSVSSNEVSPIGVQSNGG